MEETAKELGRYKKKVADQQKEISVLKAEIDGYKQAVDISYALVTAVVRQQGRVEVAAETLKEIVASKRYAEGTYDAEAMAYVLEVNDSGEGTV